MDGLRGAVPTTRAGGPGCDTLVLGAVTTIRRENAMLNAVVSQRLDAALVEARGLTSEGVSGPLQGVPFTAKDMLATKDLPTTCGSRSLTGWHAGVDATAVARLRRAGAVLVGKTNCPEFALGVDTTNDLFGQTVNPLGPWTPGGSSGGEAAAVASGMSLVGLGSDYGGSLRWPAQCTGLVGLRPTVGRVSRAGEQPTLPGSDPLAVTTDSLQDLAQVVGPLTRTVDDADLVLRVIAGSDGIDPLVVDEPLADYRDVAPEDLEVRWGVDVGGVPVDGEIAEAVRRAASLLAQSGARVSEGLPEEIDLALDVYDRLRESEPMDAIAALEAQHPDLVGRPIKAMLAARKLLRASDRQALFEARSRLVVRLRNWLDGERVLVLPVSVDIPRDLHGRVGGFSLLTPSRAISLFGLPAVSVPVAVASTGAPISVQVVAPAFREDVALAVAHLLEQQCGAETAVGVDRGSSRAR